MSRNSRHNLIKLYMTKIRIKPELLTLLESNKHKTFSLSELTDAYLELPSCHDLKGVAARQFVKRNLQRLEDKGFMDRVGHADSRTVTYRLNDSFNKDSVITCKPHRPDVQAREAVPADFAIGLEEKLKAHRLELLSTVGEIEEYELIGSETPQRREYIQGLYNQARDHYSKTLGRIRALESLISHC